MPDFKKMTVESLRDLARKVLGPGYSRLKTKRELIRALEEAGVTSKAGAESGASRTGKGEDVSASERAMKAAKEAGKAARQGVRAVARAGKAAAEGAREGVRAARARKGAKGAKMGKIGTAAAAVAGAAAGVAAAARARAAAGEGDPEGYFVARVRGEDAVREAPHPMGEVERRERRTPPTPPPPPVYDEGLGELPWSYGDDAFVALPRDPRSLFLYWDHANGTLAEAFAGLDAPRAQLWIFARANGGWERVRTLDFALESRSYYVHDLDPGHTYRAEIHVVDRQGRDRLVARPSNEVGLPPVGPSPIVDDRFIRIPWDVPLGKILGPGHPGAPFSEEARALLARLSDWARFTGRPTSAGAPGAGGGRPSSPSSPYGPFGPGDR